MEKYRLLLGIIRRQRETSNMLFESIQHLDLSIYENRYVFALKAQQLYTALEDALKSVAKAFENNISDQTAFHRELLKTMNTDVAGMRPAVLSVESWRLLDKMRAFRHFIRHAYDYELDREELVLLQHKLQGTFQYVVNDLDAFEAFLVSLLGDDA